MLIPIQPLVLGSEVRALAWSEALKSRGILVSAIRPPTVPLGMSRLRFTFSAAHQIEDIDQLLEAIAEVLAQEQQSKGETSWPR
ncbi:aminotransferase class I/II-fold pyridoxal phosphate-dependent enzyme [Cobetia crustatorum]|uniref:aminotransferase class I/II-fold pyridoxal phosphate-dependent enzyme n=1 Tax=Cobetia crustatorum TaxID=553385 RepID=UPI0031F6818C